MTISRRTFLSAIPALTLPAITLGGLSAAPALAAPAALTADSVLLPRSGKAPRIVICGGGWGGLTSARYVKQELPDAEVILLERNPFFWSAPFSNKWLIDVVDTGFLVHDMQRAANTYGYTLVQCDVTGFDRERRVVRTSRGAVDYDYLILSGGIRDAWDVWFGDDQAAIDHTRTHFASAYIPQGQMLGLKDRIRAFKGGTIVMTLPPPPHRCPPSPYERACLMAWHFKTNNIPAKIVILDPKPKIAPIGGGYKAAFQELYPDIITHVPNAKVKKVDPFAKRISTEAGDYDFDDAILMPPHQASDMVFHAGLIGKDAEGKATGWADMDPRYYTARTDDRVYVVGDSMGPISPHFGHYPKSAHVANFIGKIVSRNLGQRVRGQEVVAELPNNLCYMLVNGDKREAISVEFDYSVGADNLVHQNQIDIDVRTPDLLTTDFAWINGMFDDFVRV